MQKIEEALFNRVKKDPGNTYHVVVIFDPSVTLESLGLKEAHRLMHNIASASLSGKEIFDLAANEAIISIEPDQETGIL